MRSDRSSPSRFKHVGQQGSAVDRWSFQSSISWLPAMVQVSNLGITLAVGVDFWPGATVSTK